MKFNWTEFLIDFLFILVLSFALAAAGVPFWPRWGIIVIAVVWNCVGSIRGYNRGMNRAKAIIEDMAGVYK